MSSGSRVQLFFTAVLSTGALSTAAFFTCGAPVGAADRVVELYEQVFIPAAFTIEVGDAVTWVWREGEHRVVSGASSLDPAAGRLFDAPLDSAHPQFSFRFDAPGSFSFFDRPTEEWSGAGSITVVPFTVELEVVDLAFTPEEVSIFEGDALEWIWIEGVHTITSGSGAADPEVGLLFDAPSTAAEPRFSYAFTEAGIYVYFCRPHEHMRMFGKVTVQERFLRGDADRTGELDISDAILTLGILFLGAEERPCPDAGDANDDGMVDVSDAVFLLDHLFLGGVPLPPPYPRPGADRTEDGLLCL